MGKGAAPKRKTGWPKGRHRLPEALRNIPRHTVAVKFLEDDYAKIRTMCTMQSISVAAFLRECAIRVCAAAEARARRAAGE